jgi:transposase
MNRSKKQSVVARKCGISRPTLRNWIRRYKLHGVDGLIGESRRSLKSPSKRVGDVERLWILELRERRLGSRRIQSELSRAHDFQVSRTTIDKILVTANAKPLTRPIGPKTDDPVCKGNSR